MGLQARKRWTGLAVESNQMVGPAISMLEMVMMIKLMMMMMMMMVKMMIMMMMMMIVTFGELSVVLLV